jgi:TPP-dependent pyruvate/acetoin dehydrogenase alpha subunit
MTSRKDKPIKERLYYSLYRIRRVEEEIARIYPTDKIKSPVHLSIGQEAISVGVCEALRADDIVFGTYRGHALYLAKGGDLKRMIAELYGKITGCAKGKGGSMHMVDITKGVMGTSAIVASTIPESVGYAYAMKYQKKDSIIASFFGDGAVEEGVFHESLNFAALKRLPVIFVCENNLYAIHTHQRKRQAVPDICKRVAPYGIPVERIEGNDVLRLYDRMSVIVESTRRGETGPYFLECMTYRLREHVGPNEDFHLGYRTREEAKPWVQTDQVKRIGEMLEASQKEKIEQKVETEIMEAFAFAEKSPFPDASELYTDVFKED